MTVDALTERIMRYRSYFGAQGGVTVSGGEPLCQAAFVTALFRRLHEVGISTALDTSGYRLDDEVKELLSATDLVLLDFKYTDPEDYRRYTGCDMARVEDFLAYLQQQRIPTWLRHVLIPGYNDDVVSLEKLAALGRRYACVQKTELLPFRKLCLEKYREMGITFPLEGIPEMSAERTEELHRQFFALK